MKILILFGGLFDVDSKIKREKEINELMLDSFFWNDKDKANKIVEELKNIKSVISDVNEVMKRVKDNYEIVFSSDIDDELLILAEEEYLSLRKKIDDLSLATYLNGKYDSCNAIIEIHAGAGGTESCDWADMLRRMYLRYASNKGYTFLELDRQAGDEVGIKSVMFQINGFYAYGYLKGERGVHRLVRISPFDSNKRRHTSFAAVDVMPEIDKSIDIEVVDTDIRVDIYRSSGPGGQGVNTTDSAVRITHIPTGIVVTCQNERSQIRNKEKALEVLKSKLYFLELEKQNEMVISIKGEQLSNGFGSAKRSYVMCPYTLVKDNDSGYESSDVNAILDGEIDELLEEDLKHK